MAEHSGARHERATLGDIARRVGVSKAAVSFALNGRPGVSDALRARITAAARELHYQPDSAARALSGARTGVVGLALNRPARTLGTESFFGELIAGIESGLAGAIGLQLLVVDSLDAELGAYRRWRSERRVDGVIVLDPRRDDPRIDLLTDLRMPAVQIGSHPSSQPAAPSVWIDDTTVAETLFGTLVERGHRAIAYVCGPGQYEHTVLRRRVLEARTGVAATVIETESLPEQSAAATSEVLARSTPPTAIVYDNDVMALAGLRAAHGAGAPVPDALSIASFDDATSMRLVTPSITAMTRDTFALGDLAATTLLRAIEGTTPSVPAPPPVLSLRESTAPPAAHGQANAARARPRSQILRQRAAP